MIGAGKATPAIRPARIDRSRIAVLLVVVIALGLRLYRIDHQSIWVDEGYSIILAAEAIDKLIARVAPDHTPFYFLLLHYWMELAGRSELAVRFLSAAAGLLVVALVYRAGCDWLGARSALAAMLITAISPFAIYYSQEARMHSQATLFGLLSTLLFWRAITRDGRARWPLYALATAAALFSFVYTTLLVVAQAGYLLAVKEHRRALAQWLFSLLAVAAAFIPWLIYDIPRLVAYVGSRATGLAAPSLPSFVGRVWTASFVGNIDDQPFLQLATLPLLLPLLAVAALALQALQAPARSGDSQARVLVTMCCLLPVAAAYTVTLFLPVFQPRYLLAAAPFAYLLIAGGTTDLARPERRILCANAVAGTAVGIVVALCVGATSAVALWHGYLDPRYARDDYRSLVAAIERESPEGTGVILEGPWLIDPVSYYQTKPLVTYGVPDGNPTDEELRSTIRAIVERHSTVWLVLYGNAGVDPDGVVEDALGQLAHRIDDRWHGDVRVAKFVARLPEQFDALALPNSIRYEFGAGLSLIGYHWRRSSAVPKSITVELYWQSGAQPRADYTAFVHLLDGNGVVRAQSDAMPLGEARPTSRWLPGELILDVRRIDLPAGSPDGTYTLEVGLYGTADGKREDVQTGKGRRLGTRVVLEAIDLTTSDAGAPVAEPMIEDVSFGKLLVLESAAMESAPLRPGETAVVSVGWRARRELAVDYTVFLHMVDGAGRIVAQADGQPGGGFKPTSAWPVDRTITDRLALRVPSGTSREKYALCLGLYDLATMLRLEPSGATASARCGSRSVEVGAITVVN